MSVAFAVHFLPISAGNVRSESLTKLYRESPLFQSLRDESNLLGKCGRWEYKQICGGSRARAYALTDDIFAEEPCCSYQPRTTQNAQSAEAAASIFG